MKQPSNIKQNVITTAKPKTKKTLTSAKNSVSVEKKLLVSAPQIKLKTLETSPVKTKTKKPETFVSGDKIKFADLKKAESSSAQTVNSKSKTVKTTTSNLEAANKNTKSQPIAATKKTASGKYQKAVEKVKIENPKKAVLTKKVEAKKASPLVSVEEKTPEVKKIKQIVEMTKTKNLIAKTEVGKNTTVKSQKPVENKKTVKSQPGISTTKIKPEISAAKLKIAAVKSEKVGKKTLAKKETTFKRKASRKTTAKVENKSFGSRVSKIAEVADQTVVAVHLVKKLNLPAEIVEPKSKKISRKKVSEPIEIKAEVQVLETAKPKPKKAKAISSAVFRGAKNRYDFTVFPLDAVFEDVPAIYVISRRVVDKSKKAHHSVVCIGQTESLLEELKKHRKDKRAKKFAANSISLLHEENENLRLKIETDLKAAHAIRCSHL